MSRPEWLKFTSRMGRKLCIKLIDLKIYDDTLNCDDLALRIGCTIKNDLLNCPLSDAELIEYISKLPKKTDQPKIGRPFKNEFETRKNMVHELLKNKNSDKFDLIPADNTAEVLNNDDLFIECLQTTVDEVKKQFFENYPEKVKKHPSIWFRFLCNTIKLNSPKIVNTKNFVIIGRMWEIYSQLCIEIGINRTLENFQIFSGLGWQTIEELRRGQNPACVDLGKKIYIDCKNDIISGLGTSFGSSPNQMFIAKSVYGLTENSIVTHVSASEIKKTVDDIPLFLEKND